MRSVRERENMARELKEIYSIDGEDEVRGDAPYVDLSKLVQAAVEKGQWVERLEKIGVSEEAARFLATLKAPARRFWSWYAKRDSEGAEYCVGGQHVKVVKRCDPTISQLYTSLEVKICPCDGSCQK